MEGNRQRGKPLMGGWRLLDEWEEMERTRQGKVIDGPLSRAFPDMLLPTEQVGTFPVARYCRQSRQVRQDPPLPPPISSHSHISSPLFPLLSPSLLFLPYMYDWIRKTTTAQPRVMATAAFLAGNHAPAVMARCLCWICV